MNDRKLIHNTAQFAHCLAQGKVGSGFDISAAVWGSHRYRRFDPEILSEVMDEGVDTDLLVRTLEPENEKWNNIVTPFKLPPGLRLILADIDAGSHTPTLVSKVLAWRKTKPTEANALWKELGFYNSVVEDNLRELSRLYNENPGSYGHAIESCANVKASEWNKLAGQQPNNKAIKILADTTSKFDIVRQLIRKMSMLSGVPVEPPEQTRLLDACMNVPGVLMAGVPGAGGYDAIFCITLSESSQRGVQMIWHGWDEMSVGPLLTQEDFVGARLETLEDVKGLAKATKLS